MRVLAAIVIGIPFYAGLGGPVRALEFCDKVTDLEKRLVCLQEHISVIEEKLLAMSTQITDLRNAVRQKLDAEAVYKLQQVGVGRCLSASGEKNEPGLQSCNSPDSWKLLPGSQKPGAEAKKQQEKEKKDKEKAKEEARGKEKDKAVVKKKD